MEGANIRQWLTMSSDANAGFLQAKAADSPHCSHSELRTSQTETSHTWAKNTTADISLRKYQWDRWKTHSDSYVTLAVHSAEKCYWDRRWHVAAPRSRTRLKRKRWAPLFSAAWLYKSCSAPKTKVEAYRGVTLLYTTVKKTQTHTHTVPCLQ